MERQIEEFALQPETDAENYSPQVMKLLDEWERERAAMRAPQSAKEDAAA